ncbi:MAG: DUF1841 family protein [Nitrospirae bacterium]|nr:DUF1841 family protein [Candidatus Manganitrophaceae bacterium]
MDFMTAQNRARFFEIWKKAKENQPIEGEEALFAEIMLEHREHHSLFDLGEGAFNIDFAARRQTNPFLHTALHAMVEQQIRSHQPVEVEQALLSLLSRGESRHEALHRIGGLLAQTIHEAVTQNKSIDEARYLSGLREFIR